MRNQNPAQIDLYCHGVVPGTSHRLPLAAEFPLRSTAVDCIFSDLQAMGVSGPIPRMS